MMVAEAMLSVTSESFRTVNLPAATVAPGAATLDTDVLVTLAPGDFPTKNPFQGTNNGVNGIAAVP